MELRIILMSCLLLSSGADIEEPTSSQVIILRGTEFKPHPNAPRTSSNPGKPGQMAALDEKCLNGSLDKSENLEWVDENCYQYRCVETNGTHSIEMTSCAEPELPSDAIECHTHESMEEDRRYPFCCPKLRCIVNIDGKKYIHVVGQPGEVISNKNYKNCDDLDDTHEDHNHSEVVKLKKYPLLSAKEQEEGEDEALRVYGETTPLEVDTMVDWLMWPLEAIFASETEFFRVVRYRNEKFYDFHRMWQRNGGKNG